MKIQGKRIVLRTIGIKDAESIAKYANNKDVHTYMGPQFPYPYTVKDALWFIDDTKKKKRKQQSIRFGIQEVGSKAIIGMIGFESISKLNNNAEVGYWLGKPFWGKGYMSEALALMVAYGFKEQKFHKIYARVYSPNKGSIALLDKLNFELEGHFREHTKLTPKGKFLDQMRFGLLKKDWKQ